MQSSSGAHFIALDHVRALAAFMVFTWHFTHAGNGYPVPFEYVPVFFPLSLLDEGHTGVALFMTLSGYLFAKLLDGKSIHYGAFLWNRAMRLLPLLTVVIIIVGIQNFMAGDDIVAYAYSIAKGVLFNTLPNGGWSITVEFHYYLILPLLLWMLRKSTLLPVLMIIAAITLRALLHHQQGEIQSLAYGSLVGRIDQFTLGMLIVPFRTYFAQRHILCLSVLTGFALFYEYFNQQGGFYQIPTCSICPSPSPIWIFIPTLEGVAYAIGIAWYEGSFSHANTGISKFIARIGDYSYAIYLLHFFVVFSAAKFVNEQIMGISNFYLACLWSLACFLLMVPLGYLSFRFIEEPFLKLRKHYISVPRL
jgi:peptidoglycan/LPS O-acetylase OafA/YrhL